MNRYERLKMSKFKRKRKIANKWYYGGGDNCSWDQIQLEYPDAQYWKDWHYSRIRKYARECTEGIIRSKFRRSVLNSSLDEDVGFGSARSHYRKHFDFWWTVF